jgi:succinate dehydrogenase flavin-adding protein (antitoxin of CptAB toxin-antitoxin module)
MENPALRENTDEIGAQDRIRDINRLLDVCPDYDVHQWLNEVSQLLHEHMPEVLKMIADREEESLMKPTERNHF